ncbi:unnamed protein product [Trypanosoma congolense IL3000]|uniref:adenylate cyclase n=1 Tax=Trypanosoma congolense (strain IL3000) TaxID=1068625 RepID=F9WJ36_TRYCI|nr:unnamed protein product [Trypanosoma congolense IL3000]
MSGPRKAYILAPSKTQTFLIKTWKEALSESGAELIPGQLIISGTNPLANETRYEVIRRFQREMNAYLDSTDERRGFDKPPHFLEDDTNGELMVAGWIAGEVIAKALQNAASLGNRDAFMHSLYDQRRYLIDDLVLGDYGGPCVNLAAWQGATCKCNQGGSVVYMKEVVDGYRLRSIRQGFLTWGTDQCSSDGVVLQAPLNGLTVLMTDNEVAYRASSRYASGASAFLGNGRAGERDRLFLQPLEATGAEAPDKLEEMRDIKVVSAIFAAVNKGIMGIEDIMFIDPITLTPRLNRFKRHLIYLSPTLAQEFYVLAQYISETASGSTNIIIRTHDAEEILKTLTATLVTFGVPIGAKVQVEEDGWMMDHLPTSGNVFLIGLKLEEIEPMATHLNNYRGVRVFVIYPDLTLMYEEFKDAFINSPQSSKDRLVFATNQLHWADVNSTSATIKAYHAVITDETMRTPMTLRGFTTARLMQTVLTQMRVVSAELLSSYFFDASTITIDDMRYGPYSDVDCIVNGVALATNCLANYGATNIAVWSMSRIFDPQVSELQSGMTPSLVYIDRSGLTLSQIIGITVGSLIAVLLFAVLGVTLFITLRNARDNDRAPTEPLDPVTVIFTDIESSTAQWAAFPEFMPDAVATHHSVVRSLIAQHNCYEVKTIGDSFMIACRSPLAAVDLCCEMQRHFLHHDWRTELFDEFYRNFEGQRAQEDKEYAPPSANLDPEVYREMWNGLRVRIGIHTGLCDIRYDQVTKGYDYYGQTTNMAARTESVANGGQVLLTGATYYSLSAAERDKFDVTPLGPVPLRGVSEVVDMFQVNAVPCRKFAALRLDREYYFEDGADGTTATTSDNSSTPAELSESAQMLACSLQALLSTFKPPQREKLLLPYCERWRVPLPKPRKPIWDDEYCQEVVRCLAMKVGRVVDHSAGGTTEVTSSTRSTSIIILSNRFISFDDNYSAE